jgi:hypothetical protein
MENSLTASPAIALRFPATASQLPRNGPTTTPRFRDKESKVVNAYGGCIFVKRPENQFFKF